MYRETEVIIYPRKVVKATLARNAASVMLAHNHPSGSPQPSEADLLLTKALVQALALIDVRVLDHFVVAGAHVHSFAEHGQL
jgi:DNA repair protein RadC